MVRDHRRRSCRSFTPSSSRIESRTSSKLMLRGVPGGKKGRLAYTRWRGSHNSLWTKPDPRTDRQADRERERERQIQTGRQTDRQADRQHRQTERQAGRQIDKSFPRQTGMVITLHHPDIVIGGMKRA